MVHVMIDRYFSLFLKGLKIVLNLRLSLIVPLRGNMEMVLFHIMGKTFFPYLVVFHKFTTNNLGVL